ncbi:hypothetical protein OESDEN_08565 [Oesophagostomum dentatum]|uniref:ATP-dependent DNA helicase n=1 Tax=Oesophagostomum dentatum TaxID=61180 RepID=A0A0B1T2V9_OESDE|nr:hypothetical protein OESDEN_08565 [Oesophagostomum dentatum]
MRQKRDDKEGVPEEIADIASLKHIEKILRANGSCLTECGLTRLQVLIDAKGREPEVLDNVENANLVDIIRDDKDSAILLRCVNLITNNICLIPRIPLVYNSTSDVMTFKRFQFPVRLSFCMTMNKSQGQTFEKVGLILRSPAFAHGTIYVALSRVRCRENVKLTTNGKGQRLSNDIMKKTVLERELYSPPRLGQGDLV